MPSAPLRKAYADAVLENLRYGLPVIQWREGRVVKVPAEELAPRPGPSSLPSPISDH